MTPSSCHDKKVISAIPYGVFYRLKVLSSSTEIFEEAVKEYSTYLLDAGYSSALIGEKLTAVRNLDRLVMLEDGNKKNDKKGVIAALVTDGHPAIPSARKAIKNAKSILNLDKVAKRMLQEKGRVIPAVRRLPYLSEILGTGKDPSALLNSDKEKGGYIGCGKCDLCKYSIFGSYVTNPTTGLQHKIKKKLTCTSKWVIYIYFCSADVCKNKPYVGRAVDMRKRHANHKSHINSAYSSCKLTEHMISVHHGNFDNSNLKVMVIDTIENLEPQTDTHNITKWRTDTIEQLEEHYRTTFNSYVPHGLNVKGESNYKKWGKSSASNNTSTNMQRNLVPVFPQPMGRNLIPVVQQPVTRMPVVPQPMGRNLVPQPVPRLPVVPQPMRIASRSSTICSTSNGEAPMNSSQQCQRRSSRIKAKKGILSDLSDNKQ